MPSFSSLFTSLNRSGLFYEKNSRHATYNFSQDARSLYRNQPRFPFEYYININLSNVGTAKTYISQYFNSVDLAQIMPLVKSIEMPSIKIDTATLNQYNRKRISQSKIAFEPVKAVFHDVADGKTLKFWDMYYRYYFADGNEFDKNSVKQTLLDNSPNNTNGEKSIIQNIVSDTLDNHNFGFNLPVVSNIRNLIQNIDIYQVHGGRFNQVTLVNPRVSAFTHDVLNYAAGDKTLELTFTFEYEYAYYTIQNMKLNGGEPNNNSTIHQFGHGEFLDLPSLAFNTTSVDFIESNNPSLQSDNPIFQRIDENTQSPLSDFVDDSDSVRTVSSSALDGLVHISPAPNPVLSSPIIQTRPFTSSAVAGDIDTYTDINRIGSDFNV